jgi:hypothetical protein
MESLAQTVTLILFTIVFTGPISLFLTWKKVQLALVNHPVSNALRKALATFLATIGILFSVNLIFSGVPVTASLVALAAVNMNILAIRNEYFRHIN